MATAHPSTKQARAAHAQPLQRPCPDAPGRSGFWCLFSMSWLVQRFILHVSHLFGIHPQVLHMCVPFVWCWLRLSSVVVCLFSCARRPLDYNSDHWSSTRRRTQQQARIQGVARFQGRIERLQVSKFQGSRVLDCQGSGVLGFQGSRFQASRFQTCKGLGLVHQQQNDQRHAKQTQNTWWSIVKRQFYSFTRSQRSKFFARLSISSQGSKGFPGSKIHGPRDPYYASPKMQGFR